jgi:two-component system sensor histidine kinase RpfC
MLPAVLFHRMRQRLGNRADSEHAQVLVRIAITSLFSAYLGWQVTESTAGTALFLTWLILLGELGISFVLLAAILSRPAPSHARRWVGMLADYTAMAAVMYLEGEAASPLYGVYLWVTIGNGLRYGPRYLHYATVLATVSFLLVIRLTPYWLENPYLSWGLLAGLVAVPLYFSSLLKALTRAIDEARRANEAKSRFLANMSHEFRTPLNGLAGTCELLATTRMDAEQREYVRTIQASSRSLLALVEDVLDISAIEAGKLKLRNEDFSIRELVDNIGLILQPLARAKQLDYQVRFAPELPALVNGDPGHLRQVLINLMGNAIKFTEQGYVRLSVTFRRDAGHPLRVRFRVSDSGIGIAASTRDRLFEAFEQADSSLARRHAGSGLGTTIAKGLTEAMGGSIGFESVEQGGSEFWVELPFSVPLALASSESVAEGTPNVIAFADPFLRHRARVEPMRLLIADDHAANRMVLQGMLQKAGHKVVAVDDGEAVLAAVEASDYDVVIADLHMPGLSGLDMLRQLRVMQAGAPARTPGVILSAGVSPDSIQQCERAGARAFLAKPVVASRLLDTLADIATGKRIDATRVVAGDRPALAGEAIHDPQVLHELRALGLGEAFEAGFVRECLEDAQHCLDAFRSHAEAGQWPLVRDQVHALKGVAGNLGLVMLVASSDQVMRLADWQLVREWRQRLNGLQGQLAQGRDVVLRHVQDQPGASSQDHDGAS